jgi:hypothetical protein
MLMNREEAVRELKAVVALLQDDVAKVVEYGKANPTPYAHRMFIRAEFALVEGLLHQMRQVTFASLAETDLLRPEEVTLLRQVRYTLDKKGHITETEQFENFLPNMLFTLRMYAKNHGTEFEPNTGEVGWEAMHRAVRIRNSVTHPKSAACLDLSEQDMEVVFLASRWWERTVLNLFQACNEADSFWRGRLETGKEKPGAHEPPTHWPPEP